MRASFLILLVCVLQGCTALGAGFAADLNRQRRANARVDVTNGALAPGDSLVLHLASGSTRRGALVALHPDSVRLDAGTFALANIDRVERPWQHSNVWRAAAIGAGLDLAAFAYLWYGLSNLSIPLDINL